MVHTIQTLIMVVTMRRSGVIAQAWGVEAAVGQTEEGGRDGFVVLFLRIFENICLTWVNVVCCGRRRDEGKEEAMTLGPSWQPQVSTFVWPERETDT